MNEIARHGRLRKPGPWGTVIIFIASALAVVLVATLSVSAIASWQLASNIQTVNIHPGEKVAPPPSIGAYPGGFNVLIVGSDTRVGQHGIGAGAGSGGALNDVNILLHVSGDHTNATAVSIPRDMVVPMPRCQNGGPAAGLPINNTLSYGGLPCVVSTVEALTGLKIQFAGLITFTGVIEMSDVVGGVQVCVKGDLNDTEVGLHIKSGYTTLAGYRALQFLRSRHGVGDGSDLGRISSQQVYLSSLVRKLKDKDTLSNFGTLYNLASSATRNMQLSSSLNSVDTMISIAQALRNIPLDRVQFVQYPGVTGVGGIYAGKVAPVQSLADQLFALIKADKPFTFGAQGDNRGSVTDPNGASSTPTASPAPAVKTKASSSPAPKRTTAASSTPVATPAPSPSAATPATVINGYVGQSASTYTCSKANTN